MCRPGYRLLIGVVFSNAGLVGSWAEPALKFAAGTLLKVGIALVGFRLAFQRYLKSAVTSG